MLGPLLVMMLAQAPAAKPDACALIAPEDVHRVIGVDARTRTPGTQQARGLLLSQCYVDTGTARSVSIALAGTTTSKGHTVTPTAFWREQFHAHDHESEKDREKEEHAKSGAEREREEEGGDARKIAGIGDEAYWSGNRVAGALYVLHGKTFIRVSIGGIQDERERIEKSKQLASAALKRLPK